MSALDSLKVALNKENKHLQELETNARNKEESYNETIERLMAEGYVEGLTFAINLLENQTCTSCKAVREIALHGICTSCYYGIKGAN